MSADNEIAVVRFEDGYRVNEIRGCPDESQRDMVVSQINMGIPACGRDDAIEKAEIYLSAIEAAGSYVEYGITIWD